MQRPAQIADELRRRRIAIAGILRECSLEDRVDRDRHRTGSPRASDGIGAVTCAAASAVGESACERPPAGEELPRDDRERVPVAGRAGTLAPRLLRRQVPGGAEDRARLRERLHAGRGRDPEVGDLHVAAAVADQVPRLDVAVDDAGLVRRVERRGRVLEPAEHLRRRARAGGRSSRLPPERYSITISGRPLCSSTSKIVTMLGLPERRAAASASRLKRCLSAVVLRVALGQHLDGDVTTELLVGGPEDLAHAAAPDVLGVAVTGRKGVGRDRHARLGNRGVPHSTGWKRSVKPGRDVEGLGYRDPHARGRQGSFRPPARRRLCSPRGRRRFLAACGGPARAPGDRPRRPRRSSRALLRACSSCAAMAGGTVSASASGAPTATRSTAGRTTGSSATTTRARRSAPRRSRLFACCSSRARRRRSTRSSPGP